MKILFIENRYSTKLWYEAAIGLAADGHEIHWLVQNKSFRPRGFSIHLLRYPQDGFNVGNELPSYLQAIARTDRSLRLFGVRADHYPFYQAQIEKLISEVCPDIVFGEATQFHELMTIDACKSRNIAYISPNATRYPVGRLVFYRADTFEPIGGCGESLSMDAAEDMLHQINTRSIQPSYMAPPKQGLQVSIMRAWERFRIAYSWFQGERYITPSPWCHIKLGRTHAKARYDWEMIANERDATSQISNLGLNDPWVLYPLQLQPESNLDVYGQPWINQANTLDRAAASLAQQGAMLVVKPNPKSKYEMSQELIESVRRNPNVIPLPHDFPMDLVFPQSPLVLSVTGTVILESIFTSKPVCVLGDHELSKLPGVTALMKPEQISEILNYALVGQACRATRSEALELLRNLHATSYDAILWDPIARPDLFNSDNLKRLRKAFREVVASIHH